MKYLNGKGFLEQDEGGRICVIKRKDDRLWDRPIKRFLGLSCYILMVVIEGFIQKCLGVVTYVAWKYGSGFIV
jgi:hypothetical protein